MALQVADNFSYLGGKPLDTRIKCNTISDLTSLASNVLYDGMIVYVTSEKKFYTYDSTNPIDSTLQQWTELKTSGANGGCEAILGCFANPPSTFGVGDKYYDTTYNSIFTSTDGITWDTGKAPEENVLYLNLDTHELYAYVNNVFEVYGETTKISAQSDNALIREADGLYVKDLETEIQKLNWAQKTVNDVGEMELLSAPITLSYNNATTLGTAITTNINQDIVLTDDITNYDDIEIYYTVDSASYKRAPHLNKFRVNQVVYNNSNTFNALDGSIMTIVYNPNTSSASGFGAYHIIQTAWFKDSKTLFLATAHNPATNGFNKMSIVSIVGKKTKSVTIDPVEYVNTEYGIEDSPVGHIMATMSNTAPAHYLICDGTEYNILDYPDLAEHFKTEFGQYNCFGGDGTTTFAVPDLRGEFLRGTGTNSHAGQGSGTYVGRHQDATEAPIIQGSHNNFGARYANTNSTGEINAEYKNVDSNNGVAATLRYNGSTSNKVSTTGSTYTTRPTNTSVLYVIKYEKTYFMNIGDITYEYGCEKINGVVATLPTTFTQGDKYYNTTDNLLYVAKDSTTWEVGQNANPDVIYLNLQDNKIYNYNNGTLEVFGGGNTNVSKEDNNAIIEKQDGIYVKDLQPQIDAIDKYNKYLNTQLDYCFARFSSDITKTTITSGAIMPFNKVEGNLEMNNNAIKLFANKTYELESDIRIQNGNAIFAFYNVTEGISIGQFNETTESVQGTEVSGKVIFTPTVDTEVSIKNVYIYADGNPEMPAGTATSLYSYFSAKEINRQIVIDPVNYVNVDKGIEDVPVGTVINVLGSTAPKHYLRCDGTIYNIATYKKLAQYIEDQFGYTNFYGGDGITTFAVPNLEPEKLWLNLKTTSANSVSDTKVVKDKITITSSSTFPAQSGADYKLWEAFNGTYGTAGDAWHSKADGTDTDITVTVDFGELKTLSGIRMYPRASNWLSQLPITFDIEASNDGSDWTVLKSYTNLSQPSSLTWQEFNFDKIETYRYYRLTHMKSSMKNQGLYDYVAIGQIEFLIPQESKFIKYEPTYFVGTIKGHEYVVDLIDNRLELETDHANVIKTYNTLQSLKESISNFDKIEIGAAIYDGSNEINAVTKVINVRDIEYLGDLSTAKYQISLNTLTAQGSWFANVVFNFSDDKNIRIVRTAVETPADLWNTIIITHIRGIKSNYDVENSNGCDCDTSKLSDADIENAINDSLTELNS